MGMGCATQGAQPSALWLPRGVGDGREVQEGGDIGLSVAASCGCMTETSTKLQSNYLPIKSYQKKKKKLV